MRRLCCYIVHSKKMNRYGDDVLIRLSNDFVPLCILSLLV